LEIKRGTIKKKYIIQRIVFEKNQTNIFYSTKTPDSPFLTRQNLPGFGYGLVRIVCTLAVHWLYSYSTENVQWMHKQCTM